MEGSQSEEEFALGCSDDESEKVLGVLWNAKEDKFSYKVKVGAESISKLVYLQMLTFLP